MQAAQSSLERVSLRDRVVPTTAPGVTAQDAAYRQIEPFDGAVPTKGFDGIGRAGGGEATRRRCQRRNSALVEVDGQEQEVGQELA